PFLTVSRTRAGDNDGAGRYFQRSLSSTPVDQSANKIVNRSCASQDGPWSQHRTSAYDRALINSAVATHQNVVFYDHRHRTYRFQHTADLSSSGQVNSLSNLCA